MTGRFTHWRKASYSKAEANCVEAGYSPERVAVRDTRHRDLGYLAFTSSEWAAFLTSIKSARN
ncbi:DUF397 domain-containing protein [Nocardiopsis coralliicola]